MQSRQPIPRRASMPAPTRSTHAVPPTIDDVSDDERLYRTGYSGTSTIRYQTRTTEGRPVVVQGNRRFVLLDAPPPTHTHKTEQTARRHHWLVIFGGGMIVMILLVMGISWAGSAWQAHQLDAQYGMPRTYQTDAVVGHNGDSAANPSHFTFENLRGKVFILEIPAGDVSKALIYSGPPIIGDNAESVPITGSFQDVNGDGKPDMIVQIENQRIVYLNTGTKFVSAA